MHKLLTHMLWLIATPCAAGFAPLNITALASQDGISVIECWQLSTVPVEARSAINYDLGETTAARWSIIEPATVIGEAWAPAVQLTMVLNGLIRVSALTRRESGSRDNADTSMVTAYFQPGTLSSSLLIAADLNETSFVSGHWTEFPSNEPTVLVQIPFFDNQVPQHEVLHEGPCGIF